MNPRPLNSRASLIANTLYLRKDIERWGSGIKRIYDARHEADIGVEFKRLKSGFLVVIQRKTLPGERLGENEMKILNLLFENPRMSITDIAEIIGISTTAVEKNIAKLKQKGLLKGIGAGD